MRTLSSTFHNVDSSVPVSHSLWRAVAQRVTYLQYPLNQVPVYLVKPATIDRFTGTDRTGLAPDSLRRMLDWFEETVDRKHAENERERRRMLQKPGSLSREFEERIRECARPQALLGCYIHALPAGSLRRVSRGSHTTQAAPHHVESEQTPAHPGGPAILLCPERIFAYQEPELVFQNVLIHELAHAWRGMRAQTWKLYDSSTPARVIEESLANAVTFVHFDEQERASIGEFMSRQPAEYAAFGYWLSQAGPNGHQLQNHMLKQLLADWRGFATLRFETLMEPYPEWVLYCHPRPWPVFRPPLPSLEAQVAFQLARKTDYWDLLFHGDFACEQALQDGLALLACEILKEGI